MWEKAISTLPSHSSKKSLASMTFQAMPLRFVYTNRHTSSLFISLSLSLTHIHSIYTYSLSLQVGLISFSTGATVEFDLNDHQSVESVREALDEIIYTRGWTATAFALGLTRLMLDPFQSYGARPFENGIPKVAVLLTDGRSNQVPITDRANALHNFGVQVSNKQNINSAVIQLIEFYLCSGVHCRHWRYLSS